MKKKPNQPMRSELTGKSAVHALLRTNPVRHDKLVIGVPGTGSKSEPGAILGERVLGHRDQADPGSLHLRGDD